MGARSRLGICILGLGAMVAVAHPYETISRRNIFHLVPREEPVAKTAEVLNSRPDIRISGVAAFGSQKWVLLTKADPGKEPRPLLMREGEKDGGLEIVSVDELDAVVKVRSGDDLLKLKLAAPSVPKINLPTSAAARNTSTRF